MNKKNFIKLLPIFLITLVILGGGSLLFVKNNKLFKPKKEATKKIAYRN